MRDELKLHLNTWTIAELRRLAYQDGLSEEEFDTWLKNTVIQIN